MERPQSVVVAKESQDRLQRQFKNLEQQWDTVKQSKPHSHSPMLRRCSTDSKAMVKALQLMNNSPRDLMSSLQQRRSPSEAVGEILRERRLAIESGKLKGRRLFGGCESETEMGFEGREDICSGEVWSVCSYSSRSSSSVSDGKVEREVVVEEREIKVEHNVEERRYGGGGGVGGNGGKLMFLMACYAIALMVFTLGLISMKCIEGYGDEDEVTLVPT